MSPKDSAFLRTLDLIGAAICAGTFPEGSVLTVQQLVDLTGASRIIVREATQVLTAAGLVEARQRVGIRVLPSSRWNPIDVRVVGWRLKAPTRSKQISELLELRATIEPAAARLAATRRTPDDLDRLSTAAAGLRNAAVNDDNADFLLCDTAFHRALLSASGNSLFLYLSSVIETALTDRDLRIENVNSYDSVAIDLHRDVATHIAGHRPARAERAMLEIVRRAKESG
jgi:DNA-binding FadR family transcriptional regulator